MKVLPNLLMTLAIVIPLATFGASATVATDDHACPTNALELEGSDLGSLAPGTEIWYHHTYTYTRLQPDAPVTFHVGAHGGGWIELVVYAHDDCTTPVACQHDISYDTRILTYSGETCTVGPGGHYVKLVWTESVLVEPGEAMYLLSVKQG